MNGAKAKTSKKKAGAQRQQGNDRRQSKKRKDSHQDTGQNQNQQQQRRKPQAADNTSSYSDKRYICRSKRRRSRPRTNNKTNQQQPQHNDGTNNNMSEIEEQLRRQREQQRQQKLQKQNETSSTKSEVEQKEKKTTKVPATLGNYQYDSSKNTYFPVTSFPKNNSDNQQEKRSPEQVKKERGASFSPITSNYFNYRFLPKITRPLSVFHPLHLSYGSEVSPIPQQRTICREMVGFSSFFKRMTVESGLNKPQSAMTSDLVCKPFLHPSSRTFDATMDSTGTMLNTITIERRNTVCAKYNWGVSGDFSTLVLPTWCQIVNVRNLPLYRSSETATGRIYSGLLVQSSEDRRSETPSSFALLDMASEGEDCKVVLESGFPDSFPNDFAINEDNLIMFAPSCLNRNSPAKLYKLPLSSFENPMEESVLDHKSGFPMSDAFCINTCTSASAMRSCFVMGHRSGQLSLLDSRTPNLVCRSTERIEEFHDGFGAVTALNALSNGNEILAKGSFGDCRLYDIRLMGTASPGGLRSQHSPKRRMDSAVVRALQLPTVFDSVRSKMSQYCNGVTTVEGESMVIAPLLDQSEEPCFGCWSLRSGQWIGQRQISPSQSRTASLSNDPTVASSTIPPYLELCSSVTPVFGVNESGKLQKKQIGYSSLWFKCGRLGATSTSNAWTNDKISSIHQLSWDAACILPG